VKPRSLPGVVTAELPDGALVASLPDSGNAVILNQVGGAVLDLCDGVHTVDEITAFICEHTAGAEPAAVAADVVAMVDALAAAGLIEDACGSPSAG